MERRLTSRNVSLDWIDKSDTNEGNWISALSIQNTYVRLKLQYELSLRQTWVEQLESPNQVLEQLSLAACLIELWRVMYGAIPAKEQAQPTTKPPFPGFVDIACGSGILVYVLHMEGYKGSGFDACRRKSWETFPEDVQACLEEKVIIPQPFMDVLGPREIGIEVHSGGFPENTFIISDHADELTVWTPIMAALASPSSPLPFFVIPCCSRSLAGSSYRYPLLESSAMQGGDQKTATNKTTGFVEQNPQPCSGDLRALRAAKMEEKTESGFLNSMIGSLAAKTMSIAGEVGYGVEKTWLRTPGAINMALIGGRDQATRDVPNSGGDSAKIEGFTAARLGRIMEVVERECLKDGGIHEAARLWIERARGLHLGNGIKHQASS
ncbi:tRNA (uracil-O(2)-)-methyltransferase [Penicillium soppii]|uniref:tRNA (uracil-O(2)-)-methyltransferase n=1 Tax=Penicillium soppii TaxID=69789 RepID=UPI0025478A44|nr:tRNA (uracil-O(2)-)-methyltransferase [Penicillium soppii]KAJ5860187.1 tRNA (uracil-O(2)-)-methyltransferase [Penicillium soppii]